MGAAAGAARGRGDAYRAEDDDDDAFLDFKPVQPEACRKAKRAYLRAKTRGNAKEAFAEAKQVRLLPGCELYS